MSFPPPPGAHLFPNLAPMPGIIPNLQPNQFPMPPIPSLMLPTATIPGLPSMPTLPPVGITLPTGVATISAPPVRKIDSQVKLNASLNISSPSLISSSSTRIVSGKKPIPNGPTITVFVGNISDRASDMLIRQLLGKCGHVKEWKRVQGANGKLQAFGFCEFSHAESAMRAIRLLHDLEIGDKKLVVKVDPNTQTKIDDYMKEKKLSRSEDETNSTPKEKNGEKNESEEEEKKDFIDDDTRREDAVVKAQLHAILKDHEPELMRETDKSSNSRQRPGNSRTPMNNENLADMDIEEEKRSLIHREIDKFRDTYKADEKDRLDSSSDSRIENRRNEPPSDRERDRDRDRDRDREREREREGSNDAIRRRRDRDRERDRDRDRDRERDRRSPDKERRRDRDRERDRRDRDRDKDRDRPRERERDRYERPDDRSTANSVERISEDADDIYEQRRLERKLREKEESYQARLRRWEEREQRKQKEYEKLKLKQDLKKEDESKIVKRLKQFLEDYDDDRDDSKYYKNNTRLAQKREKEKEEDDRDRRQEIREIEELKRKLTKDGHPDPESEAKKLVSSTIEKEPDRHQLISEKIDELMIEARYRSRMETNNESRKVEHNDSSNSSNSFCKPDKEMIDETPPPSKHAGHEMHVKSFSFNKVGQGSINANNVAQISNSPIMNHAQEWSGQVNNNNNDKRKKMSVQDVFNSHDDDSDNRKRRRLPTFEDNDSNQSNSNTNTNMNTLPSGQNMNVNCNNNNDNNNVSGSSGGENNMKSLTSEEKKKQVKALIDNIPTSKDELFQYNIDWNMVDTTLMEKRIRPWINKKITEYIGEEEKALLDFICSKLQSKSSAKSILNDVAMVLDEEAEVFVVKMWRLLIYEIEAKKLGIAK